MQSRALHRSVARLFVAAALLLAGLGVGGMLQSAARHGATSCVGTAAIGQGVQIARAVIVITRNEAHGNALHAEAELVRSRYREGMCRGTELWFSPSRGTVLILCGIRETTEWGGLVYRVTEDNGQVFLYDQAYECSVFVATRSYWDWVVKRDGYKPLANYPNLERLLYETFGR